MAGLITKAHPPARKRSYWFLVLELIFVVSLLSNMVIYGGIPSLPGVGAIIERSVVRQDQVVTLYMRGGEWLLKIPGLRQASHQVLNTALAKGTKEISEDPGNAAMLLTERSYSSTHSWLHLPRWVTPIFFLASVVGQFFRPKQIKTLR